MKTFFIYVACDYRGQLNETVGGQCVCKELVTGDTCSKCIKGHWNLTQINPKGCQSKQEIYFINLPYLIFQAAKFVTNFHRMYL